MVYKYAPDEESSKQHTVSSTWNRTVVAAVAILLSNTLACAQFLKFVRATDSVQFEPACISVPNQISYEAVFRLDVPQASAGGQIYTEHRASWWDRQFSISAEGVYEYTHPIDNGTGWFIPVAITSGVWHHLAFCYDGAEERFYFDGALVGSRPRSGNIFSACGVDYPGGGMAAIGYGVRTDGAERSSFIGSLDSIRVSSSARYSGSSFTPPLSDLSADADTMLLYNFNECTGTGVIDAGPLHRNGILGGQGTQPVRFGSSDLNADGAVNTTDLTLLLVRFGQSVTPGSPGDINGDGLVNTADLVLLLRAFGQACP